MKTPNFKPSVSWSLLRRGGTLIGGLLAASMLFGSSAVAQTDVDITPTSASQPTGSEQCYDIPFRWASTTVDGIAAQIVVSIPATIDGDSVSFPSPIGVVTAANFDPGTGDLTFTFVDPLPAGTAGVLTFCAAQFPGVTPDGTVSTFPVEFIAQGVPVGSASATLTGTATGQTGIDKTTAGNIEPALDESVTYILTVDNNPLTGNYDLNNAVLTDTIPACAVFQGANPAPDTIVGTAYSWDFGTIPAGETRRVLLTVSYPSSCASLGQSFTNDLALAGDNLDGVVSLSTNDVRFISPPGPGIGFGKSGSASQISNSTAVDGVDETFVYSFNINNFGNVAITNYVVEDFFAPEFIPTRLTVGYDTFLSLTNSAVVEVQVNGGAYQTVTGSPFTTPTFDASNNAQNVEIDLTGFSTVTAVRMTYSSLHTGYDNGGTYQIFGEYRSPTVPLTYTNNASSVYQYSTNAVSNAVASVNVEVIGPSPRPVPSKSASPGSANPTEIVTYTFNIANTFGGSLPFNDPTIVDLLPIELEYVPGSFAVVNLAGLSFLNFSVADVGGRDEITMTGSGSVPVGSTVVATIQALVLPGTPDTADPVNMADLSVTDALVNFNGVALFQHARLHLIGHQE